MRILRLPSHDSLSSESGAPVDFPAPGGACNTTFECAASAVRSAGKTLSIGNGTGAALTGALCWMSDNKKGQKNKGN